MKAEGGAVRLPPGLKRGANRRPAGEDAAAAAIPPGRLTVVRPPAIYGPGDRETFAVFRIARASPVLPVLSPDGAKVAFTSAREGRRGHETAAFVAGVSDGKAAEAVEYLNVVRRRAAKTGVAAVEMDVTAAQVDDALSVMRQVVNA